MGIDDAGPDRHAIRTASSFSSLLWWGGAACVWSLVFAVLHFYWAAGGRRGLGAQTVAADEALEQGWFFAYNLLVGLLAIGGAVVAVTVVQRLREDWVRRLCRRASWGACVVLTLRGLVGLIGLGVEVAQGVMESPLLLALIEPWFVVGGVLFGVLAAKTGRSADSA